MLRQMKFALTVAVFLTTWTMAANGVAQTQPIPKLVDKQALGEEEVKQLLLLMDTDKS